MKKNIALIWIIILLTMVSGCAEQFKKFSQQISERKQESLLQSYLQTAKEYEKKGNLAEAYKNYKLALTISPQNQEAVKSIDRFKKMLRKLAEKYYLEGMKLHNRGKYRIARRKFLTALKFRPDHAKALKMLTLHKHISYKKDIEHIIKQGETLAMIAVIYYGDYRKFSIIAEYNNITDATQVNVGQNIKVPKIEGVPFLTEKQDIKPEEAKALDLASLDQKITKAEGKEKEESVAEEVKEELEEPVNEAAIYKDQGIEFFNKRKYQEAISEFNKVINVDPDDATAVEYLASSHFQCAVALFKKKDYLKAKKEFETSLEYNENCPKCREYIKKSEETYVEIHYKRGVAYFGKEQLAAAIMEWELVLAIDSKYKEVANNIKKAKILLKRLEQIKKSQKAK